MVLLVMQATQPADVQRVLIGIVMRLNLDCRSAHLARLAGERPGLQRACNDGMSACGSRVFALPFLNGGAASGEAELF